MKNFKFCSIIGLSALFVLSACEKEEFTEEANPVLTLSQTTLTVSAEGAVVSVAYQIENPVDGASISVDLGDVTWISNVEITDSNINFTVEANTESDSRTGTVTVSYPGADDVTLTVVQEASYDYNYTLSDFTGYFYDGYGDSGEDIFYIHLSDLGFDDNGYAQVGGHYYSFYLFVDEAEGSTLHTGTYTYSDTDILRGDMVFGYDSRFVVQTGEYLYDSILLVGGSITVSAEGDTYTIEGTVIDYNGAYHRIYYTGAAVVEYGGSVYDGNLEEDLDFTAKSVLPTYYTGSGDVMNVYFIFTDLEDYSGVIEFPSNFVVLDAYMPYDAAGKIAAGTYTVSSSNESMTVDPRHSYARTYDANADGGFGYITSGTMTVTAGSEENYYTVVCDFKTYEGFSVKCTYTGEISREIYSTLTEDVDVDLSGASATAYNYGDIYGNGGNNWVVYLEPEGAGDGLDIDINAPGNASDDIPSGTYTAASSDTPAIGEYLVGGKWVEWDIYYGTWYYERDSDGNKIKEAPATSGDITFTNNGDGTYKIEFSCADDNIFAYVWSGTWEGTMSIENFSYYSTSAASQSKRSAISKLDRQDMSAKAAEMKAAQMESFMKVSVSSDNSGVFSKKLKITK